MPLECARDGGVVRRAKDQREVAGCEPVAGGEVGGPEGGEHGRHLLPEYGGGASVAAAGGPDRSSGHLHVERDRDGARVALAGRAGAVDELAVRRRGPASRERLPCCSHQSARPLPESGSVRSITWTEAIRPERQAVARTRPQRDDPALLLSGVEQHERGVGDADDRGQGRSVRVVDHDGAGLGVDPLTQPSRIARQRQRSGGARLHDAAAVQQLPAGGSPQPPRADRRPLDELPAADADERQRDEEQDDREGHHHGADVQAEDQGAGGEAGHHELGSGQAEQYAAPGQARELDRGQLRFGAVVVAHGRSLLPSGVGQRRVRDRRRDGRGRGGLVRLGLSGRLRSDEVAEPRAGRGGLLRDHHAGSDRSACGRCTSRGATGSRATAAARHSMVRQPDGPAVTGELPAVVPPPPPPPPPLSPRTLAGSLPVRRESGIGIGRLSAALASCSADIAWYMSKPMKAIAL